MAGRLMESLVVLDEGSVEEDVEEVAETLGWIPLGIKDSTEAAPYQQIWEDERTGTRIVYVWDDFVNQSFLVLRSGDVATTERQIRTALPAANYQEVVDRLRAAADPPSTIDAVRRLTAFSGVVGRNSADPEVVGLLRRAVERGNPDVRRMVITAAGYLEWPALLALLSQLQETDPEAEVREAAGFVLRNVAEPAGSDPETESR